MMSIGRLMEKLVTTDQVHRRDRVAFWCETVCETFVPLECGDIAPADFFGSVATRELVDIQFSEVTAQPHSVTRTRRMISRSCDDYFLLGLQIQGSSILSQDGRTALLRPGDFALYDTTRPYDLNFREASVQLVLRLSRTLVGGRLADAEDYTARRIDGQYGAGRLASSFIRQLHENMDELDAISLARLHASTVDLAATALAERTGADAQGGEAGMLLRRRVLSYIDRNLADVKLNCATIAAAHGVSERYLRKVFENSSISVAEWIWSRRLEQARRDLADPLLKHLQITAIGYDVGFKDPAHFSRAFKAKFGITPSQHRSRPAGHS